MALGHYMRTLFAASSLAVSAVLLAACSSESTSDPASEETASTSEALARRGIATSPSAGGSVIVDPGPGTGVPPKRRPGVFVPAGGGVLAPPECVGTPQRFDLRRISRSCEDLPGAYVQNGATLVPGNGGHFRVARLLEGTSAPDALKAKACIFTWEPDACAAPDKAKLLVEPTEHLDERPATCVTNPGSCGIKPAATAPYRIPHVIPNGSGRCEVCGFASNRSMWVVLPQYWRGFKFQLANQSVTQYVYIDPPASAVQSTDETTAVEVTLPDDVADQDVKLDPAYQ